MIISNSLILSISSFQDCHSLSDVQSVRSGLKKLEPGTWDTDSLPNSTRCSINNSISLVVLFFGQNPGWISHIRLVSAVPRCLSTLLLWMLNALGFADVFLNRPFGSPCQRLKFSRGKFAFSVSWIIDCVS